MHKFNLFRQVIDATQENVVSTSKELQMLQELINVVFDSEELTPALEQDQTTIILVSMANDTLSELKIDPDELSEYVE